MRIYTYMYDSIITLSRHVHSSIPLQNDAFNKTNIMFTILTKQNRTWLYSVL